MMTPRRHNKLLSNTSEELSLSTNALVVDFTQRLLAAAESAADQRGQAMIAELFSAIEAGTGSHLGKAAKRRADRERRQLASALTRQLLDVIDQAMRTHSHEIVKRELARASHGRGGGRILETSASSPSSSTAMPVRRRTRRARPNLRLPPPLDPEQIKRDQEFARLRALLRPAADLPPPPLPAPEIVAPPIQVKRPASPGDILRALEKEIQNAVPNLGVLGPERCGAQIAAWVGEVRGLRDRLPEDVSATMRPAFRIFLEHLTQLRMEMEAHLVDALEPNWKAPDWEVYVEVNRARAEQREPALPVNKIQAHHRAMLRALVLPHRRNVPQQAIAIINAASQVLPPDDSLLQSAVKRHHLVRRTQSSLSVEGAPAEIPAAGEQPDGALAAEAPVEITPASPAELTSEPPSVGTPIENEFDSTWTK